MRVLGTAGHVDHGKSTLVRALTGIDPDRLQEEQERQMTIDLGFAWMTLPTGEEVGIIDVPGHRDFIENMLAGVGGIDAALLVVAADEGVMPQTREHLAILDLLNVRRGVVALTKIDLVDDEEWLSLVREDIAGLLEHSALAGSPILAVSAVSGEGLEALVEALGQVLARVPARRDVGRPRLPIDRSFIIAGFGSVVTGTLADGSFHPGQEVLVLPSGKQGRIRGLQTHRQKVERAVPGSRVAMNLSGIEVRELSRGDVVTLAGDYEPTSLIDAQVRLLADAPAPLKSNDEVKLFLGAAECMARARVLGAGRIDPGEEGWLQLMLSLPVVAAFGDRFILRRPSPAATLGGGIVVDAHPPRHQRKNRSQVVQRLQRMLSGSTGERFAQALAEQGLGTIKEVAHRAGLTSAEALGASEELLQSGRVMMLEEGGGEQQEALVVEEEWWKRFARRMTQVLATYHEAYPLRAGMPREELKSRLRIEGRHYAAMLKAAEKEGAIRVDEGRVAVAGHAPQLNDGERRSVERLLARFIEKPATPPSVKESVAEVGSELYEHLVASGRLVQISNDVVLTAEGYAAMVDQIRRMFAQQEFVTVAEVRDRLNSTRKYALALMEHLDEAGMTVREGEARRLRESA